MKTLVGLFKALVWLILTPFILIGCLILAVLCTLLYQAYWDWRVEVMCAREGGRFIHERIVLSPGEIKRMQNEHDEIDLPDIEKVQRGDKYAFSSELEILHQGLLGLRIQRLSFKVFRVKDYKLLAERISFSRVAGDFPFSASNSSGFRCPKFGDGSFYQHIFTMDE